jgi:hypothetical protein
MKWICFISTILIIGCNDKTTEHIEIRPFARRYFSTGDQLNESIKATLIRSITRDSVRFSYTADSITFVFGENTKNESMLVYFNSIIPFYSIVPLVDKKVFLTDGQQIEIRKYVYDDPNIVDEEESIFFIEDYGVIAIQNNSKSYFLEFDKGGENQIFKLLQQDTSGFCGYRKPGI